MAAKESLGKLDSEHTALFELHAFAVSCLEAKDRDEYDALHASDIQYERKQQNNEPQVRASLSGAPSIKAVRPVQALDLAHSRNSTQRRAVHLEAPRLHSGLQSAGTMDLASHAESNFWIACYNCNLDSRALTKSALPNSRNKIQK